MDLRKYEKLKFAKTDRLKISSTSYMQRILNSVNIEFEKKELKRKMKFLEVKPS